MNVKRHDISEGVSAPELDSVLTDLRACRACAETFSTTPTAHAPRPVAQVGLPPAPIVLIGQAPGIRVHRSGIPFDDPSGDRLRSWLGVDRALFYDTSCFSILPMGFCFPGHDAKGGDKPPPRLCARLWRDRLFAALPRARLMVLIGRAAIAWHAPSLKGVKLADAVGPLTSDPVAEAVADETIILPHPSWRNNHWLKAHPAFDAAITPHLRARVAELLESP